MTPDLRTLIHEVATAYALDPYLVEAQTLQESGGYPYAFNPEPRYPYFVNVRTGKPFRTLTVTEVASKTPPVDFPCLYGDRDQEWWLQQASIGVMQLMGAVARELGFAGKSLLELVDPRINLGLGCQLLASHVKWADGNLRKALGAYNAGRGRAEGPDGSAYAGKVMARFTSLKGITL